MRGGAVCSRSACHRDQGRVHGGDCLEPTKEKHLVYQLLGDRGKPRHADSRRGEAAFPESQPGPCPAGGAPRGTAPLSAQFSRSGVSGSLRPHELQHSRPPCPSFNENGQLHVWRAGSHISFSLPVSFLPGISPKSSKLNFLSPPQSCLLHGGEGPSLAGSGLPGPGWEIRVVLLKRRQEELQLPGLQNKIPLLRGQEGA